MKIQISILESEKDIAQAIAKSLSENLNKLFVKTINKIKPKFSMMLTEALRNEPEYSSLKNGKLRYEFGIPDPVIVDDTIEIWAKNFYIETKPISVKSGKILGSFFIGMVKDDFEDVLSSSSALVYDTVSGIQLPWLEWLLIQGGKILVRNYEVKMGANPRSRTGMAIMIESNKNWRVPSEFAGTIKNNWVTRAIDNLEKNIKNVITTELEDSL